MPNPSFNPQGGGTFHPEQDLLLTGNLRYTGEATHADNPATIGGTETLTGKTLTSPAINTPTIVAPVVSGAGSHSAQIDQDIKVLAADFEMVTGGVGSTLANVTGLSWSVIAGATYRFRLVIPKVVMTTNAGLKLAFKLTTATLTSLNLRVRSSTDTDNTGAVSVNHTTATDQATWVSQKAVVYTTIEVEGSFVVNAAGTIAVQAAQETAHADTTTIVKGAYAELKRAA